MQRAAGNAVYFVLIEYIHVMKIYLYIYLHAASVTTCTECEIEKQGRGFYA